MKKNGILFICILLAVLVVTACAKKDTVVGEWRTIHKTDMMKLMEVEEEIWIFSDDGTVVQYWDGEAITNGKYEVQDGVVSTVYFDGPGPTFTLDGSELKENGVAVMARYNEDENA